MLRRRKTYSEEIGAEKFSGLRDFIAEGGGDFVERA